MLAAIDTNVLVRLFVDDDPAQSALAADLLESAEVIAISVQAFCELVWVLGSSYQTSRADIADAIRQLLDTRNVVTNRPAVEAGLDILAVGGDFADGVIAFEGSWFGGSTFVTFDRKAAKLIAKQGRATVLLGGDL